MIRKYYQPLFLIFLIPFSIRLLLIKSPNAVWLNIVIVISAALFISVLGRTLSYLQNTRWGPAKRNKLFGRSPFKELLENGFTRKGGLAHGNIDGYAVVVSYSWYFKQSAIILDVLFDPHTNNVLMTKKMLNNIRKRNRPANWFSGSPYRWTRNSVGDVSEYILTPPSSSKIINKAKGLIEILKREKLEPLSLEEAEKYISRGHKVNS